MPQSTGLPQPCIKELKEVLERCAKHAPSDWKPTIVSEEHILHCLVAREFYKGPNEKPDEDNFGFWGLSVYAEGVGFELLDLSQALDEQRALGNDFVGAVYFAARDLLTLEEFQVPKDKAFQIHHDPFPWTDTGGDDHKQHENHAEIICKKSPTRIKKLRSLCDWSLHPEKGDLRRNIPELSDSRRVADESEPKESEATPEELDSASSTERETTHELSNRSFDDSASSQAHSPIWLILGVAVTVALVAYLIWKIGR